MSSPNNSGFFTYRYGMLPAVNEMVTDIVINDLKRITSKKDKLSRLNNDPNLNRIKKEIYFEFIYHSVATEGNSMSLDEIRKIMETKCAVPNKLIFEHNEILGFDSAFNYLNLNLANNNSDILIRDILEIHKRVMEYVDPETAGTFRKTNVFIGEHKPPAASDIEEYMDAFLKALPAIKSIHPIHIAALTLQKLAFIYPFMYGNGRTSILLMNLILLRNGYPPVIIRKEERSRYYKLLESAHYRPFYLPYYNFIARAAEYTIDIYLHALECKKNCIKRMRNYS